MKALKGALLLLAFAVLGSIGYGQCPGLNLSFTPDQPFYCNPPVTINFTNNSTGTGATTASYDWKRNGISFATTTGTGGTSDAGVPFGNITYTLVATDTSGCMDSVSLTIQVRNNPTAGFNFAPNNQCPYTNITFNNTSSGTVGGTTWLWDFGDGNTSTAQNPTHAYDPPGGTFTVTLTVTNPPGCTSTFSQNVTVLPAPTIGMTALPPITCLTPLDTATTQTVTFTNTTTGGVSYSWDYGDGSPVVTTGSTASNTHTYTTYGTFTVVMTATGSNGCIAIDSIQVVFDRYVSASFVVPLTQVSGCTPHVVTPINNSQNANFFIWDWGDGTPPDTTSTATAPSHTYNTQGSFTVTLTAINGCGQSVSTVGPITIGEPPQISFTMATAPFCAPATVNFNNTSTGASPFNNYVWHFGRGPGDSLVSTFNPPNQVYNAGTYTIMLVGSNACGSDTLVQTLFVDTIPTADVLAVPDEGCTPLVVAVTNNSTNTPTVWHEWFINGSITPNYTTYNIPNQTFTTPPGNNITTHTIYYQVENACGLDDTLITIVVHPEVVARFNMSANSICVGDSVTFTDVSYGDSLSWDWDFGNGATASTQGPHTITYNTPGQYVIQLIVEGYCGLDTLTDTLDVYPYPVAGFTPVPDSACVPAVFAFNNASTPGGAYAWAFPGGSPVSGSGFTPPNATYNTAGTYPVYLTVNVNGCVSRDTQQVVAMPLPQPAFTAAPNAGCTPLQVTFTNNTPATGGESWFWDFDDGNTSTLQNPPAHTFTNAGTTTLVRNVKLIVTTAFGCVDSVTVPVTIYPLPVAGFTAPPGACAQEPVTFTNTSTGANSYNWDFGDGNTSAATSPVHAYSSAGTYTIQLIATTAFGCADTVSQSILIDTIPAANFVADTVCVGNTTTFTDLSGGSPVSWAWDFGDGNSANVQNPTHTYATAGTYNVKLVVANSIGCPDSITLPVVVNPIPVASFTVPAACLGAASQFNDQTTGSPTGWYWDFGDGSVDSVQNPSHTYATADTFTVTLIVISGVGCSDTVSGQAIVHPVPTADFVADTVCFGFATSFDTTGSAGNPNTFTWLFGDGSTDNSNNPQPQHTYASDGTYNVTLIAGYAATGCMDSVTYAVVVRPTPVAAFAADTVCLNVSSTFTDQSTNAFPNTWLWDFDDGTTSGLQNPNHVYTTASTYQVSLTVTNIFGCVDSITQPVIVNPLPAAGFSADTVCQNLPTTFSDQSTGANNWSWDFGDGNSSISPSPVHVYDTAGIYSVTQIVYNVFGCSDTMQALVRVDTLPIADFAVSTACFGYANQFSDLSIGSVMGWNWDFGDSSGTSIQQNPQYIYADTGKYPVTLIVTNQWNCSDTIARTDTVLPVPVAGFTYPIACAGNVVQFTDTTLNNPNSWNWDFGDSTGIDTAQHPGHIFNPGGTYAVQLIAGNDVGCFDTLVIPVTVNTVPVPAFTADTVCLGNATTFLNQSTDSVPNVMSFQWTFGDGNTSSVQNPTYIYPDSGWYTVRLITSNNHGCLDSVSHDVYVAPNPIADFSADTVCLGQNTIFTDQSSPWTTSWLWDFGDGTTSVLASPVHTFGTAGNHTVSLNVFTDYLCADQVIRNVFVETAPVADFGWSVILCAGREVNFSNSTQGGAAYYEWNFGDGTTSMDVDPVHIYQNPGNYTVQLIAFSNNGCVDTIAQNITIQANPVAAFSADTVCIGGPTFFTNNSSGTALNYYWDFANNGNTSYQQDPGYIFFSNAGTYPVSLTVTDTNGCMDSVTNPVRVTEIPVASFVSSPVIPTTLLVDNAYISFTNTSQFGISYLWHFGDGTTTDIFSPSHTYTAPGEYCVSLVVYGEGGCEDSIQVCTITVGTGIPDIPNTFSPNNDGKNDFFVIRNIQEFPDNNLVVFNRWGNKVYEKEKYNNEWEGKNMYNDKMLPDGAYFFIFSPGEDKDDIVGDLVIMR